MEASAPVFDLVPAVAMAPGRRSRDQRHAAASLLSQLADAAESVTRLGVDHHRTLPGPPGPGDLIQSHACPSPWQRSLSQETGALGVEARRVERADHSGLGAPVGRGRGSDGQMDGWRDGRMSRELSVQQPSAAEMTASAGPSDGTLPLPGRARPLLAVYNLV